GQVPVDLSSLASGVDSVIRVNESAGAGARAYRVGRSRVVAIGKKNLRASHPRDIGKAFVARRDRIDAKVPFSVTNQVAVEVVSVRLGKPGPGKDIDGDFMHGALSFKHCPYRGGREQTAAIASCKRRRQRHRTPHE